MFLNKNHAATRNIFISNVATFLALITIALFMSMFINFAGMLLGAFSANASAASYSASISAPSTINMDVAASGNYANVTSSNINVISTCPSGYTVTIAASSALNNNFSDTALYKNGDKTNNASNQTIAASAGTIASPASILGNNQKTWGYTTSSNATINSNYIGLTSTQTILATSDSATEVTGTTIPIYYGVSIGSNMESGEYKMSDDAVITYYLTTSLNCTSYQVAFSPTSTAGGNTLSGTGTMDNQRIAEGVATNLDTNAFIAPSGYEFKEWNTMQDGTGTSYTDGQSVTDLIAVGGIISLYAQWEKTCSAGNICYYDNGANSPTKMGDQAVTSGSENVLLWASNFQRDGYGFAGWNTNANGTGDNYGPNETIDDNSILSEIETNGLKLYAKWIPSEDDMQNWAGCLDLNLGDITALTDTRDGETYAVAKLEDGNCWMIENLRLAGQTKTGTTISINSSNTDSPASTFHNLSVSTDPTSTAWCSDDNSACVDQSMIFTGNTTNPVPNMTSSDVSTAVYSYGNYYNWYSATAGTGTYSMGTNNDNVTGSICPAGWELPSGGDDNAISNKLKSSVTSIVGTPPNDPWMTDSVRYYDVDGGTQGTDASAILRKWPNNYVYSGTIYDSTIDGRGNDSYYWASTVRNNNDGYRLRVGEIVVDPGTSFGRKRYGRTVRCEIFSPSA